MAARPVSDPIVIGSSGFPLIVDLDGFSITGYSALALRFWNSLGVEQTIVDTDVDNNGDATGDQVRWTAVTADYFDIAGEWKVVAKISYAGGGVRYSEPPGRIPVVTAGKN